MQAMCCRKADILDETVDAHAEHQSVPNELYTSHNVVPLVVPAPEHQANSPMTVGNRQNRPAQPAYNMMRVISSEDAPLQYSNGLISGGHPMRHTLTWSGTNSIEPNSNEPVVTNSLDQEREGIMRMFQAMQQVPEQPAFRLDQHGHELKAHLDSFARMLSVFHQEGGPLSFEQVSRRMGEPDPSVRQEMYSDSLSSCYRKMIREWSRRPPRERYDPEDDLPFPADLSTSLLQTFSSLHNYDSSDEI